ncbi:MAG: ATP-dependent zinc protease [Alphaproteobacteria bacterium]|nr:ATP-dependent zinc protease [Alphaproteobacteria bacterium]
MRKTTAWIMGVSMMLTACASVEPPQVNEVKEDKKTVKVQTHAPIIGGVETMYVDGMKMPFKARVDTGAETSSIDAQNIVPFERDGEKWVAFELVNRRNGEKQKFEKPVKRRTMIVRTGKEERRYVVKLKVRMGKSLITADFSLNDRTKFEYQVLVGRNIINGRYIVDPAIENTLH